MQDPMYIIMIYNIFVGNTSHVVDLWLVAECCIWSLNQICGKLSMVMVIYMLTKKFDIIDINVKIINKIDLIYKNWLLLVFNYLECNINYYNIKCQLSTSRAYVVPTIDQGNNIIIGALVKCVNII
jgi:hypothetical protein